jgi:hypothetical protein
MFRINDQNHCFEKTKQSLPPVWHSADLTARLPHAASNSNISNCSYCCGQPNSCKWHNKLQLLLYFTSLYTKPLPRSKQHSPNKPQSTALQVAAAAMEQQVQQQQQQQQQRCFHEDASLLCTETCVSAVTQQLRCLLPKGTRTAAAAVQQQCSLH